MRTLTTTLIAAQQSSGQDVFVRLTFSFTGETDVVIEQDRILSVPSQEETDDSQKAEVVFDNSDGYFTALDFKGWQVVMEWGLRTTAAIEYSALPPMKVIDQDFTSYPNLLRCTMSFVGIPNLLAKDKASADYNHHWSDTKTVKTLIGEIASKGGTLTNLTGTATGSPITLVAGANTVIVTGNGTFTIVLPAGSSGRAISGTATVTGSPVALVGGSQTIAVTGGGAGKTITIWAVDTKLTESQEAIVATTDYLKLDNTRDGVGQLLSISSRTITKIAFRLKKTGAPAGTNVIFRIESVSSGVLASVNFAIASIGTDPAWCEATLATPLLVDEVITRDNSGTPLTGIWLFVLYTAGTAGAYISVSYNTTAVKPDENLIRIPTGGTPVDYLTEDCNYRYKYTATGISVYSHCQAYDVVFDSEDSLIDTYCPVDGFRIAESESRLDVINALLRYTGCVKIIKADGKIHVFVPVTTGVVYDYQYELETGIDIDVGSAAIARDGPASALFTLIDLANPANASGVITSVEVWAVTNITGLRVGSFYLVSGTTYKCRDSVTIGAVTAGSKQTFSTRFSIQAGDFIGCYYATGTLHSGAGGSGWMYVSGEYIDPNDSAIFALQAGQALSLYGLRATEHEFFSKSLRKALVTPDKITVHSYPDDESQYSGSYTDSESYALVPIEDFVRAKLTSNAQATAIATAMIGQLQMASQRGSATVPCNLGAEIFDYVKVTDSRQSDSRAGNLGYLKRWYTPGRVFNMGFSFSKVALIGMGVRTPRISSVQSDPLEADMNVKKSLLDLYLGPINEILAANTDDIILLKKRLDADADASPTDTQIALALIGYLKNIVEDVTPQLGGNLDCNFKTITATEAAVPNRKVVINANGTITLYYGATEVGTISAASNGLNIALAATNQVLTLTSSFTGGKVLLGNNVYLDVASSKIENVTDPTTDQQAATKKYVDDHGGLDNIVEDLTPQLGGDLDINSKNVTGLISTQTGLTINANTDYQNTSSYPILISVCFDMGGQLKVGASATPTTVIASIDDVGVGIAIIPIGWYYRTNAAPVYAFKWSLGG